MTFTEFITALFIVTFIGGCSTLMIMDIWHDMESNPKKHAYIKEHCKRISYDRGQPIYKCDDDQIYEFYDIPEK